MPDTSFFAGHIYAPDTTPWPPLSLGAVRLHDASWGGTYIHWYEVQASGSGPGAGGAFNWTNFDAVVNACAANGVAMEYTFSKVPGWANGNAGAGVPPSSYADLQAFITATVTRYKGRIRYYCPINEPGTVWWNSSIITMAAADMAYCQWFYSAVKAIDPSAIVLSPAFNGFYANQLLDSFLKQGGAAYCDVIALHVYPVANFYQYYPEQLADLQNAANVIMAGYGVSKPIFWTEGCASNSVTAEPLLSNWAAIWPVMAASLGVQTCFWYQYDNPGAGPYWGRFYDPQKVYFNAAGLAHREAIKWLYGSTVLTPVQRVATPNLMTNPTFTGGAVGAPGTLPTSMSVAGAPSGVSSQVVGFGTESGLAYMDIRIYGTPAATGYANIQLDTGSHITGTAGQKFTFACYLRLAPSSAGGFPSADPAQLTLYQENSGSFFASIAVPTMIYNAPLIGQRFAVPSPVVPSSGWNGVRPIVAVHCTNGVPIDVTLRIGAPSVDTGTIWSGTIKQPNGSTAQIVWDAGGGPTTYSTAYPYYRSADGVPRAASGGSVTITNQPVLLESALWAGAL